ncbi:DciA family protein [Kitasatospora sp. NPDC001660]
MPSASQGWALGMAAGSIQDRWAAIVGPDAATHWAPAGFDSTTRTLRVLADSPAWATQLRLRARQVLALLDQQLAPGSVRALDVRVANKPAARAEDDDRTAVARHHAEPGPAPIAPPLCDHPGYQQLRQQMRERAQAHQASRDEAAAAREEILRRHYNKLREPERAQHPPAEDEQNPAEAARARDLLARHRAALTVARATRAGAIPLRTARPTRSQAGAA